MAGHGCPLRWSVRRCWSDTFVFGLVSAAVLLCAGIVQGAETDIRMRIAWGGGEPKSWQGTIRLTDGTISEPTLLGLEADTPGSMQLVDDATLRIFPRSPRGYDGCDLHLVGPPDAKLIIELTADPNTPATPIELPLSQAAQGFHHFELDGQQNRLLAQRSPGDTLRVKLAGKSAVFGTNDKLEMQIAPTGLPLTPSTTYLLSTTILYGRSDDEVAREEHEIATNADGQVPPIDLAMRVPHEEGVYDIRIAIYPKRLTTSLVRGKPIAERKVQIVALAPSQNLSTGAASWNTEFEIDPVNPRWWERLPRFSPLRKLPAWTSQPLGNGPTSTRVHLDTTWVELPANGWQAYPLSVADAGRLHMLEIEYPSDMEQTLGVSLVEPNAAGQVVPIGLDSGIDVPAPVPGNRQEVQRLRIPFWPQTKSPLLLLTNRRSDHPAMFGRIRVQVGPVQLPALGLPPVGKTSQRMLAAYFDKPLFPENFSSGEALDPTTTRSLDDWQTFYVGAQRLIEYLRHAGYNAVVLTVACEGSAIYPSQYLQPTPKYDTGTFFETGQDPVRKDVLELILRMCDRTGIQVIPAVQLSSPLPELERLRLLDPQQAIGIEPIGSDGHTWADRHGLRRGMGVYYNPLDPRVQQAIHQVVAELAERYGEHPALAGVAIHSGPDTFSLLPDDTYSFDPVTLSRFSRETGVALPMAPQAMPQQVHILSGEGRTKWLDWRSQQLSGFWQQTNATLVQANPRSRLYLTSADLLAGRTMQQWLRPSLPQASNAAEALQAIGLDMPQLSTRGPVILPRPQRVLPGTRMNNRTLHAAWNQSSDLHALFAATGQSAAMHYHEPAPLRLPEFDAVSPFGAANTHTWFVAQIPPAGAAARQRFVHSITALDARTLIDGGWLLPLGQEEALRSLAQVYRRLPAEPFKTVEPQLTGARVQPVVVRTLKRDGRTYFYATNDSPWPLTVEIDFESPAEFRFENYSPERETSLDRQGTRTTWTMRMDAYDLAGGEIGTSDVDVVTWRVTIPRDIEGDLQERVRDLRLRANALRSPQVRDLLANPSFEVPPKDGELPGWVHARGEGITVELDSSQGYRSPQSLRILSERQADGQAPVVWVRSEPFDAPSTGRLSVVAWLRIDDPARQPKLRLAVEGKLNGATYYRRANVGMSEDGRPVKALQNGWASYRFPLTDLPLSGLTDLRVGFDLMGEGEVWIDDVQIYDAWFEDNERDELLKNIAAADFQLGAGQVADCHRFLESYWARYLRQTVPLEPPAQITATPAQPPVPELPKSEKPAAPPPATAKRSGGDKTPRTSVLERMRNWWPRSGEGKKF